MEDFKKIFDQLELNTQEKGCHSGGRWYGSGELIQSFSPVAGSHLGNLQAAGVEDYEQAITKAEYAFLSFRKIPAPQRGELVRQFGNKLREKKEALGSLFCDLADA